MMQQQCRSKSKIVSILAKLQQHSTYAAALAAALIDYPQATAALLKEESHQINLMACAACRCRRPEYPSTNLPLFSLTF
jgi:hypothetical protein